jgi:predicted HicB family RNase H-like nuclease
MMKHKGYIGHAVFDDEANIFHGEVMGLRDVVTFQGTSVDELRQAFIDSVEDYIAFCAKKGREPEKPFSGRFNLRLSAEEHEMCAIKAAEKGKSLNAWIRETLRVAAML